MSLNEGPGGGETQGAGGSARERRTVLFARLDELGVAYKTVEHPAIMTVDEGRGFKADMPGGHSKNLFLKDKKGGLFLVTAHCDTSVDLVALGKVIGARGRLSFGRPELMSATLGVIPGAVTPFALINANAGDNEAALRAVVVDKAFFSHDPIWFHPLENTASTAISPADLVTFIRACGYEPLILDASHPVSSKD